MFCLINFTEIVRLILAPASINGLRSSGFMITLIFLFFELTQIKWWKLKLISAELKFILDPTILLKITWGNEAEYFIEKNI